MRVEVTVGIVTFYVLRHIMIGLRKNRSDYCNVDSYIHTRQIHRFRRVQLDLAILTVSKYLKIFTILNLLATTCFNVDSIFWRQFVTKFTAYIVATSD